MTKPYSRLRAKMKPAARKRAAEKTKALLEAMPLDGRTRRNSKKMCPNKLDGAYAKMAKDKKREKEAADWAESIVKDAARERDAGAIIKAGGLLNYTKTGGTV